MSSTGACFTVSGVPLSRLLGGERLFRGEMECFLAIMSDLSADDGGEENAASSLNLPLRLTGVVPPCGGDCIVGVEDTGVLKKTKLVPFF